MRKHARHFLIIAAVAVLASALSGCVIIESQSSTQLNGIGSVQITTTACASDTDSNATPARPACQGPSKGGNSNIDASSGATQLLIAYRIPTAATPPDSITTVNPSGGSAFTFNNSPTFTAELTSALPPGTGRQWVGYLSSTVNYAETGGQQYFTVAPQFRLRQGSDGSPFDGPFNYRVVVGMRAVDGSHPASRDVECGSSPTLFDPPEAGICADSPSSATISTDVSQQTQDLGILKAPGVQSVNQGNVARVKYTVEYAGDGNPAPTFDLSATTDVPDATAMPSTPTLTPDEGEAQLRVIERVPVDTPPGSYDVTLVATLPNGETRSDTHEILVTPTTVRCDATAPTIAGTRGDDVLVGTRGPDVIAGYAGDDEVLGLNGDDLICTGKGDDTIRGGGGDDQIAGRRGNDLLTGGSGHNVIDPGPGRDRFIQ